MAISSSSPSEEDFTESKCKESILIIRGTRINIKCEFENSVRIEDKLYSIVMSHLNVEAIKDSVHIDI